MPSPFPGMDPYLENPALWPGLHLGLIADLQSALNRLIRPRYLARVEERVYLLDENDPSLRVVIPDVRVFGDSAGAWKGGTSVAAVPMVQTIEPIEVTTFIEDEIHEPRIEVMDTQDRSVVTVIEILSPKNKVPGSRGQASYSVKRHEVMHSRSHLLEIDLLRAGTRIFIRESVPPYDYLVHVSRCTGPGRRRGKIWPIAVTKRLPLLHVPLGGKDPDVEIELQAIFNSAYDRGAYDADIDYTRDPIPPLTAEQAEWAKTLIAAHAPD